MKEDQSLAGEFYSVKRISASELADFMGISVRTLQRMDESGVLPASRDRRGRRIYTSEHVLKAVELMNSSQKRLTSVKFGKNGSGALYPKVEIPRAWLNQLGITAENPEAEISFDGENIIIKKKYE